MCREIHVNFSMLWSISQSQYQMLFFLFLREVSLLQELFHKCFLVNFFFLDENASRQITIWKHSKWKITAGLAATPEHDSISLKKKCKMLCNSRGRFRNAFSWHEKLLVRQFRETLLYMEGLSRKVQYNKSIHHKNRGVQGNLMCTRICLIHLFIVSDIGQTKGISFIILFVILFYNIISCCNWYSFCV